MTDDIHVFFEDYDHYTPEVSSARYQDFSRILRQWLMSLDRAPEPLLTRINWLRKHLPEDRLKGEIIVPGRGMMGSGKLNWPDDLEERLSGQLQLLEALTEKVDSAWQFASNYFHDGGNNISAALSQLVSYLFEPHARELRRYLQKHVNESLPVRNNSSIPASDRIVTINHNSPEFGPIPELLAAIEEDIRGQNNVEPDTRDLALSELRASREILSAKTARVEVIRTLLIDGLKWIAIKFAEYGVSGLIAKLVAAVRVLFGI